MTQPKRIWTPNPDNRGLVALARRVRIRPRVPPRARVGVRYEPQYVHWKVVNPDGSIAREGEQHNTLLNVYKSLIPTYGIIGADPFSYNPNGLAGYAVVGIGVTPPDPSQTTLDNEIARIGPSGFSGPNLAAKTAVSDGVYDLHYIREFPAGTFNDGTPLTEWGFSPSGTPGDPLMCRELFRDPAGNPTTVNVSSSQRLQMHYYVRVQLQPVTPQPASVTITGVGTLTGQVLLQRYPWGGTYSSGLLTLADTIARGQATNIKHAEGEYSYDTGISCQIGAITEPIDLAYTSSIQSPSRGVVTASYGAPSSNSRSSDPVLLSPTQAVGTIYGFVIGLYKGYNYYTLFARYVFQLDAGQEFTKDNVHTLTIDSFTLSW